LLGAALPAQAATFTGIASGPGVMWITGDAPTTADAKIQQTMKAFVPALLVVSAGSSVQFPNDDSFYHSVYSDSPSNPFDLGLYDTGPGKSVVFSNPGVVDIRCHIHGSMHATLVVVDGPFVVTTHPGERYHIDGVAPGQHVLHVWTDGTAFSSANVTVK
jgi:plastocyanin